MIERGGGACAGSLVTQTTGLINGTNPVYVGSVAFKPQSSTYSVEPTTAESNQNVAPPRPGPTATPPSRSTSPPSSQSSPASSTGTISIPTPNVHHDDNKLNNDGSSGADSTQTRNDVDSDSAIPSASIFPILLVIVIMIAILTKFLGWFKKKRSQSTMSITNSHLPSFVVPRGDLTPQVNNITTYHDSMNEHVHDSPHKMSNKAPRSSHLPLPATSPTRSRSTRLFNS
jgi:hypothetical protein